MINKDKVILMSKLAQIDEKRTREQKIIESHYIEDYIYLNNVKTRVWIILLVGIGIGAHVLWKIEKEILIPTSLEQLLGLYVVPYVGILVAALALYTLISTLVATKRYHKGRQLVDQYAKILKELNALEKQEAEKA